MPSAETIQLLWKINEQYISAINNQLDVDGIVSKPGVLALGVSIRTWIEYLEAIKKFQAKEHTDNEVAQFNLFLTTISLSFTFALAALNI